MSIRKIIYTAMALMAMGFTACTQNEDMAPTLKGQEINATFSVGGMQVSIHWDTVTIGRMRIN